MINEGVVESSWDLQTKILVERNDIDTRELSKTCLAGHLTTIDRTLSRTMNWKNSPPGAWSEQLYGPASL